MESPTRPSSSPSGAQWIFVLPEHGVDLGVLKKELLVQALGRTRGNQTRAGKLLGLSRDQVRYWKWRYGIE